MYVCNTGVGGQVFVITGVCLCLQVWVDRYM